MSNDIAKLLERLTLIEGATTPATVKSGLNPQQKSVDQLPALFQPKKISPVLTAKKDPAHPMKGKLVGDDIQVPVGVTALEEAVKDVEEDMLDRVRRDLNSYLSQLKREKQLDNDLVDKAVKDIEDRNKSKPGIQKSNEETVAEDPTESEPPESLAPTPTVNPVMSEQSPVTVVAMEDGKNCEIYGDQGQGFEIGYQGRRMPSRFKTLEQATMAIEMYRRRRAADNQNRDYLDEA
jgi:hypothetical protein